MSPLEEVARLRQEALERIGAADSLASLKEARVHYLGRKGRLTAILKGLKDLPVEQRKLVGAEANN
ncbi:MAG: phenylalanine--tRNA ligase subunit alpha, partial [candidate division Zixibacteria bacterium]|nr:phenylalanine--tRNA ligase subunit alpha [candidate division Zixibacteria bacterium]